MKEKRAKVYTHFEPLGNHHYQCLHCGVGVAGGGQGTSNLHKHMSHRHPHIDRYAPLSELDESGDNDAKRLASKKQELIRDLKRKREEREKKKKQEQEDPDEEQSTIRNGVDGEEETLLEAPQLDDSESEHDIAGPSSSTDNYPKTILKRMKQLNADNAELQNQLLHQQYDSQNQRRMIKSLRKDLNQLKNDFLKTRLKGPSIESAKQDADIPNFPIHRMSDMDELEERLVGDPELKRKLGEIFKSTRISKVNSIMEWMSKEILAQFTVKVDRDSLTIHRSTEYSEIFQLIFRSWSEDGCTKIDFNAIVRDALETATSELAAENYARNMRKTARQEPEFLDFDNKNFIRM